MSPLMKAGYNYVRAAKTADSVKPPPGMKGALNYSGQRAQAKQMAVTADDMQNRLANMKADLRQWNRRRQKEQRFLPIPPGSPGRS